jgi:hypothetical protein
MIVLQYNDNIAGGIDTLVQYAKIVKEKYLTEDVLILPDGLTLLQLDNDTLESIVKNLVEYARLKGIDI